MKHFKYLSFSTLTLAVALGSATSVLAAKHQPATILFTQIAKKLEVISCQDKTVCDYRITLKDVTKDKVTYFSDRPNHFTGEMTVAQFVSNWAKGVDSFAKDRPNASLVYFDHHRITQNVLTLSLPKFDAKKNTLSYDVKELGKAKLKAGHYQHPTLFIDGVQPVFCWFHC